MLTVDCMLLRPPNNPASPWNWNTDNTPAWRVYVDGFALSLRFASKRDAETGMATLEAAGLTNDESIRAAGPDEVRRLLVQNLPW